MVPNVDKKTAISFKCITSDDNSEELKRLDIKKANQESGNNSDSKSHCRTFK